MRLHEVTPNHHSELDATEWDGSLHHRAASQAQHLGKVPGRGVLAVVVVHDLGLRFPRTFDVAGERDLTAGGHDDAGYPLGEPGCADAIEQLDARTGGRAAVASEG